MLGGKNKHRPLGYTIVEVMIVLAVSSMMFLIAANFINGKQERASLTQGSTDTMSLLQNVVEDITDGHYSDQPIACSVSGGGSLTFPPTTGPGQGQNPDCVFLGKLVYFYDPGAVGGTNRTGYQTFSLAGARSISGFPSNQVAAIGDLTVNGTIPQSLNVKDMTVVPAAGGTDTSAFNIGFVEGVGTVDPSSGTYLSGAQQPVRLVYASGVSAANFDADHLVGTAVQPAKSATICLTDGRRYAQILIGGSGSAGGNNNQLSIRLQQLGTTPC